jgi:hypothetical protein
LFAHIYLPHYVWINKAGILIAITGSDEVNEGNIGHILNGDVISMRVKKDLENYIEEGPSGDYTLFAPSIKIRGDSTLQNLPVKDIKFHSILTRYNKGLIMGAGFSADGTEFTVRNSSIRGLYRVAFSGNSLKGININSLILDIPDSVLYNRITTSRRSSSAELRNWLEDNGYCYSIRVLPELANKKEEFMLNELNNYFGALFGIEGRVEKRICKYLALVCTDNEHKFADRSDKHSSTVQDKFSLVITGLPFKSLINDLTIPLQNYPILLDETGYTGNIDLELNCQLSNLIALNKELSRYGLQLIQKEKMMDIGVIKIKTESNSK